MPRAKRGPRLSLVPVTPVPEAVEAARMAELAPWVQAFRFRWAQLWPAPGTGVQGPAGSYRRRYPWPECWTAHPSLVTELQCLKLWADAIEEGNLATAEAIGGGFKAWGYYVHEITGPMVQEIARVCMSAGVLFHRDPAVPMRDQSVYRNVRILAAPSRRDAMGQVTRGSVSR